jgi:hypothetical protein
MTNVKIAALKIPVFRAILATLAMAGPAWADSPQVSANEAKTFSTCMALPSDQRAANSDCLAIMRKEQVTNSDMDKMKSCESNPEPATENPDCVAMLRKHPSLSQGHGMDSEQK